MSEYRNSPQKSEYRNSPSMSALDEKASKGGSREGKSPKRSPSYRKSAALDPCQLDSISLSSSLPSESNRGGGGGRGVLGEEG